MWRLRLSHRLLKSLEGLLLLLNKWLLLLLLGNIELLLRWLLLSSHWKTKSRLCLSWRRLIHNRNIKEACCRGSGLRWLLLLLYWHNIHSSKNIWLSLWSCLLLSSSNKTKARRLRSTWCGISINDTHKVRLTWCGRRLCRCLSIERTNSFFRFA